MNSTNLPHQKSEVKCRWDSVHEWLFDKISEWNEQQLRNCLMALAYQMDEDTLQDIFQPEMDRDGFFDELSTTNNALLDELVVDDGGAE